MQEFSGCKQQKPSMANESKENLLQQHGAIALEDSQNERELVRPDVGITRNKGFTKVSSHLPGTTWFSVSSPGKEHVMVEV